MREVDEANTGAKRAAIVSAATRCLARRGIAKTSIGDICTEAGMRSGHLYYYFANKDAVLEAVLFNNQEHTIDAIEHMLDHGDLVSQIVDVHVQAEERRMAFGLTPAVRLELQCYFSRMLQDKDEVDIEGRILTAVMRAIERGIAAGRLPRDLDIKVFAAAIGLIWQGLSLSRLLPGFDVEVARSAVRLLMEPWLNSGLAYPDVSITG